MGPTGMGVIRRRGDLLQGMAEVASGIGGGVVAPVGQPLVRSDAGEKGAVDGAHDVAPNMPRMLLTYEVVCA